MNLKYCLTGIVLFTLKVFSQEIKPLTIGDNMPNISFGEMYNYNTPSASLSQFKGKIILLDFWATWCSACIKKIPLLDSLQKLHEGLQVILISALNTGDTKEKVSHSLNNINSSGEKLELPIVLKDTIADKMFSHKLLPHYVWLDKNLKVIAITGGEEVTAKNVEAVLNGRTFSFPVKEDITDFNRRKPLFVNGNGGNASGLRFRSTLSSHINGLPSGSFVNRNGNGMVTGIIVTNMSRYYLLREAYRSDIPVNRTRLRITDSLHFLPADDEVHRDDSYCYELITPPCTWDDAFILMQQDLQRYFGMAVKIEKLITDCYVMDGDTTVLYKYKSRGGKQENLIYDASHRYIRNEPLSSIINYLDAVLDKPVADETGVTYNLDIDIGRTEVKNISALKAALQPYGITLTPSKMVMDNLIIYQLK